MLQTLRTLAVGYRFIYYNILHNGGSSENCCAVSSIVDGSFKFVTLLTCFSVELVLERGTFVRQRLLLTTGRSRLAGALVHSQVNIQLPTHQHHHGNSVLSIFSQRGRTESESAQSLRPRDAVYTV